MKVGRGAAGARVFALGMLGAAAIFAEGGCGRLVGRPQGEGGLATSSGGQASGGGPAGVGAETFCAGPSSSIVETCGGPEYEHEFLDNTLVLRAVSGAGGLGGAGPVPGALGGQGPAGAASEGGEAGLAGASSTHPELDVIVSLKNSACLSLWVYAGSGTVLGFDAALCGGEKGLPFGGGSTDGLWHEVGWAGQPVRLVVSGDLPSCIVVHATDRAPDPALLDWACSEDPGPVK